MIIIYSFIILIAVLIWQSRRTLKLLWQMPGPPPVFSVNFNDAIPILDELSNHYKDPFRFIAVCKPVVFVSDAENAKLILNSKDCLDRPKMFYKVAGDVFGVDGLITLESHRWKLHRRLIRPSVGFSNVISHMKNLNRCVRDSIALLPETDHYVDILPQLTTSMAAIFMDTSLGSLLDNETKQKYLTTFVGSLDTITERLREPIMYFDFVWNRTETAKRLQQYQYFHRRIFAQILQSKCGSDDDLDRNSIISRLMKISNENLDFTFDDVYAETITLLSAATETTAVAIAFTAVMLALYPEYKEKVHQEVCAVMPDEQMNLEQNDLDKLKFTELCIRETLRLFPSLPFMARISDKPLQLSNGIIVPANTPIVIGLRQIAIKTEYFGHSARQFDPNRFLNDEVKNLPSTSNMPFGFGPRNCIGYIYAQIILKLYIAQLIRRFRVTTSYKNIEEMIPLFNVGLRLVDKHMIKLERRV